MRQNLQLEPGCGTDELPLLCNTQNWKAGADILADDTKEAVMRTRVLAY